MIVLHSVWDNSGQRACNKHKAEKQVGPFAVTSWQYFPYLGGGQLQASRVGGETRAAYTSPMQKEIGLGCLSSLSSCTYVFRASAFIVGYLCAGGGRIMLVQAGLEPASKMSHLVPLNRGAKGW